MLLAKTLTSSTFKLALIAIGTFGVIVSAIFSYVYLSASSYVRSRSALAIMTEYLDLPGAYVIQPCSLQHRMTQHQATVAREVDVDHLDIGLDEPDVVLSCQFAAMTSACSPGVRCASHSVAARTRSSDRAALMTRINAAY